MSPGAATTTLESLRRALVRGDADGAAELGADDGAAQQLAAVARNVDALDLTGLGLRYLAEGGAVADDGAWTATVEVTWRYAGFGRVAARGEAEVSFSADGTAISALGGDDGLVPLWLRGPVASRRTADTLVLGPVRPAEVRRVSAQAQEALAVARRVLGDRADRLVVELPDTVDALHAALDVGPDSYTDVAAVTTAADGRNVPGTPVHVFVNPVVYGDLGPVAAQVVMSHEAVHAVTDAPLVQGPPLWLVEGFADYVALRDVDLPLATTAGQVIARVREDGVPAALPSRAEFDTGGPHLGASYEAAWLACVTLAERGGEEALVAVYDAVLGGADLAATLRDELDWSVRDLTTAWQDRLSELAGDG